MSLSGYVDVTTFHASPTASTNQAPYIQAAINYLELATVGGGVCYFPPGTYLVCCQTGPALTVTGTGIELRGAGVGASKIQDITPQASNRFPLSVVHVDHGNVIRFRDIGFIGNNAPPTTKTDTTAEQATLNITGGAGHKIQDCYFTQNRSYTVRADQVTDMEVTSTRFHDVGYNDTVNAGDNFRTDAIYYDTGSLAVRANQNSLSNCNYGGITFNCNRGEASNNRMKLVTVSNIYPQASQHDIRIGVNGCLSGQVFPGSGGNPIYTGPGSNQMPIMGNVVSKAQADGFSVAGVANTSLFANLAIDSNSLSSSSGDSGLQINTQAGHLSQGIAVVGMDINQGDAVQEAIRVFLSGSPVTFPKAFESTLMGNVLYNSQNDTIKYEWTAAGGTDYYPLQDDSNQIIGNGFWIEREHISTPGRSTTTSYTTMLSVQVNANTMLEQAGVRLIASGSLGGGTSARHFNVGFGPTSASATNIMSGQAWTPAHASDTWQLICVIVNDNATSAPRNQQGVSVQFWAGGTLLLAQTVGLAISTDDHTTNNQPNFIFIQAKNGASGDTVSTDLAVTERF